MRRPWYLGIALLAVVGFAALLVGPVAVDPFETVRALGWAVGLAGEPPDPIAQQIVIGIRLPRIALAGLVGALLAIGGAACQAVFRNPLAEPSVIGISSGCLLGATLGFAVGLDVKWMPVFAFLGGLAASATVFVLASASGEVSALRLLLAGLSIATLLAAIASLILSIVIPDWQVASAIVLWQMGSVADATPSKILVSAGILAITLPWLWSLGSRLNVLTLGDDHAESLGIDAAVLRRWCLVGVSLATGTAVAVSGVIGFVGLLVPLGVRVLLGPDLRRVIPFAAVAGAVFLVAVDAIGRTILAPREIRLGIICSVVGAPVFLTMLFRSPSWTIRN